MANISNYVSGVQNYETLAEKRFNNFADMVCWLNIRNGKCVGNYHPFVGNFNLDVPTMEEIHNNAVKSYKKRMLKMFHERFDR